MQFCLHPFSIFLIYVLLGPYRQLFGHMFTDEQEFTVRRSHTTHSKLAGDHEPSAMEHVRNKGYDWFTTAMYGLEYGGQRCSIVYAG